MKRNLLPLDKLRVCQETHTVSCAKCVRVCVYVCATVCQEREREQVSVIKTVDLIFLFSANKHLLTLYVYSLSLYNH